MTRTEYEELTKKELLELAEGIKGINTASNKDVIIDALLNVDAEPEAATDQAPVEQKAAPKGKDDVVGEVCAATGVTLVSYVHPAATFRGDTGREVSVNVTQGKDGVISALKRMGIA